jgi:hypothetical protein
MAPRMEWTEYTDTCSAATGTGAQSGCRAGGDLPGGKGPTGRVLPPFRQSSLRMVPVPRFLVNSALLLRSNKSR